MLGLKKGTVKLYPHQKDWETEAQNTILRLWNILKNTAKDIQHIGSTSIPFIKAKPIIDIVVATYSFEEILAFKEQLEADGFYFCSNASDVSQLLFACGSYYNGTGDEQTHFIHIVKNGSTEHINYINFRDYLKRFPEVAKQYEKLKVSLYNTTSDRVQYTNGKHDFIVYILRKALVKSYLGKTVEIIIDRPIGSIHPKYNDLIYPLNYGFIPNVLGGDGEELDVYLLGVYKPVENYKAQIIGIAHRKNDSEDKLIGVPIGVSFSKEEVAQAVYFQEKFYDTEIETL